MSKRSSHKSKDYAYAQGESSRSSRQQPTPVGAEWSQWLQDPHGRWYMWRYDSRREVEYYYHAEDAAAPRSNVLSSYSEQPDDKQDQYQISSSQYNSASTSYAAGSGYPPDTSNSTDYKLDDNAAGGTNSVASLSSSLAQTSIGSAPNLEQGQEQEAPEGYDTNSANYIMTGSPPSAQSTAPYSTGGGHGYGMGGPSTMTSNYTTSAGYNQASQQSSGYKYSYDNPQTSTTSYNYGPSSSGPTGGYSSYSATATQQDHRAESYVDHDSIVSDIEITARQGNDRLARHENFKVYKSKDFKPGYVFKVLWSEPKGETNRSRNNGTIVTDESYETHQGQQIHTKMRRFIIVGVGNGHNRCIPILTYGFQGTGKHGAKPHEHAIIHTGEIPPQAESPLMRSPIRMAPKNPREKLDPMSRIHYAKTYTVEHNLRVLIIGKIHGNSERTFLNDFNQIHDSITGMVPADENEGQYEN
ncbi:hypothetical protein GLAREA_02636 [Glarea lozoyensis ATCC 20868]|uniref:DUF6590 domain-containing protein n=1 Tax=Glarea lozoyensis (strain ATCC 20868 / MF5171) TaxID=1116229 RepID=S3CJM7_GLAL2|nr:uncharacterized protein GLAREA_02636 [Glarea lozoyensis ATCC 20868]EPE26722.1 hypothetical protein GLAREA_02636 [Glarea lozoyensis ATCC 20868]